jgi:hypothetical protein
VEPSVTERRARAGRVALHAATGDVERKTVAKSAEQYGASFLRSLALPNEVAHWSLTTLRERLVKIGAWIVRHGRYVIFQLAEVAVSRTLFVAILRRIDRLRGPSGVTT